MSDHSLEHKNSDQKTMEDEAQYYKRDFWGVENLKYSEPHYRMRKVSRVIRDVARGRECDLLDVGCGPATLRHLMPANVHYHGIDIAIPEPAPNLIEMDIIESPIGFRDMRFDIVVAQGMFEYVGEFQSQKFTEIVGLLKPGGKFVLTYQNFAHREKEIYWPYSNVQQPVDFRRELSRFFAIEKAFPGSHNWHHSQPQRKLMKMSQAHFNINVPVISPILAVDYFYICSPLEVAADRP